MEKIKLSATCGCYVGEPKWTQGLGDWHKEPDECTWEGIVEVNKEEWDEEYVAINCPKCNAVLTQEMDHFQIAE